MSKDKDKLPMFDLSEIDRAESQAEVDRKRAEEMGRAVESATAYVEKARGSTREALELEPVKSQLPEARALLEEHRLDEVPVIRRKVWLAILGFELTRPLETPDEVKKLLADLEKKGFLLKAELGKQSPFRAYGKGYTVSPDSLFGEIEVAEVKKLSDELCSRVQETFRKGLLHKGSLSWKKILAGKTGSWSAVVPERIDQKNSVLVKLHGGVIYCEVDEKALFPQQSSGYFHIAPVTVGEGRQRRAVGIMKKSLTADKPVFTDYISDRTQLGYMYFAWDLLRGAVMSEEEAERMQPLKNRFTNKATLATEELFFGETPGTYYVEHEGAWEVREYVEHEDAGEVRKEEKLVSLIPHLFLLVERKMEEEEEKIRIAEVPDHLEEFFAPCMSEYTKRGDKFEGVGQPLRAVLQAVWKQAYSAAKDTDKAERIAGNGK